MPRPLVVAAALLALAASPVADAASRMVVTAPTQIRVVLDQQPVSSGAGLGRITISHITPGRHHIVLLDLSGAQLYQATIDVPDNVSATLAWDGTRAQLTGISEVTGSTADAPSPFADPADTPAEEDTAALERAQDEDPENMMASRHGQQEKIDNHAVGGRVPYQVTQVTGQAASAVIGNPVQAAEPAVTAVTGGFSYMVHTAEAGTGRKRYDPAARQGRPDVAPPVLETVKLTNTTGAPLSVFVDGMWLHDFAADEWNQEDVQVHEAELEVGRRELQFIDRRTRAMVYQGSLRVKEGFVVELSFSDVEPPRADNANWAWAPQ